MFKIERIYAIPSQQPTITIVWNTSIPNVPFVDKFVIYRRLAGYPDWQKIGESFTNFFVDYSPPSINKQYFNNLLKIEYGVSYVVGGIEQSIVSSFLEDLHLEGLRGYLQRIYKEEIRRNSTIYYDNFGEDFWILVRKYAGPLCPVCYNPEMDSVLNPECPVCFGTGYEGGYVVYKIKGQFVYPTESYTSEPLEEGVRLSVNRASALLNPVIPIKSQDILVRYDGTRWMISQADYTRVGGGIIHQVAQVNKIEPFHPIYRFSIKEE